MNHAELCGSHREMGFRYGSHLAERGKFILEQVPFPLTEERRNFAAACVPVYRRFFPEILEELEGLAAGQGCPAEDLGAVLFSMYALPPGCCCSCFAVSRDGAVIFGRNSDFLTALEEQNLNVICRPAGAAAFTGNTTAFLEMEDGVNQHGLAVGLTSVVSQTALRPGFQAGLLVRLLLERCRSTAEALAQLARVPIASAQTLTLADRGGDIAVAECDGERLAVCRPSRERPYVRATNVFHAPGMPPFDGSEEDCWFARTRYDTLTAALDDQAARLDATGAQALLAGKFGFLCQYDRRTGRDTVWSVVYDLGGGAVYRAEGNPSRTPFLRDRRFAFPGGNP